MSCFLIYFLFNSFDPETNVSKTFFLLTEALKLTETMKILLFAKCILQNHRKKIKNTSKKFSFFKLILYCTYCRIQEKILDL